MENNMARKKRDPKQTDLAFILMQKWPMYPLLPLVKREGSADDNDHYAFIHADHGSTVFIGNHEDMAIATGKTWADVLRGFPTRQFKGMAELVEVYGVD
jgi:hypothetical protein